MVEVQARAMRAGAETWKNGGIEWEEIRILDVALPSCPFSHFCPCPNR